MCTSKYSNTLPKILILGVESLIIILANIATVIVFRKRRSQLRQTFLFLMNLTVADLMVGVGLIEDVVNEIWKMASSSCTTSWEKYVVLNEIFGGASISFLALISLERLYATVWPFRIRTTSRRKYICSVGVVWFISGVLVVFKLLMPFPDGVNWVGMVYLFVCLITISCAYSVIWFFYKKKDPRLPPNRRERNKKLANTLFIVTLLSLITWLPYTVVRTVTVTFNTPDVSGPVLTVTDISRFLRLTNSLINPIVYCFRMPLFSGTLREMFFKRMKTGLHVSEHETSSETIAPVLLSVSYLSVRTKTNNILSQQKFSELS